MLTSGAGLLAFALVDLVQAVQDADEIARTKARDRAEQVARELRLRVGSPKILDDVPAACRFELAGGEIVVPADIGWLHAPPAPYTEANLPMRAWLHLRESRQKELLDENREAAAAAMASALTTDQLTDEDRLFLLAEAAWQSHRFDRHDQARRLWQQLIKHRALDPARAASGLLLMKALRITDREIRARLATRAAALPEELRPGIAVPEGIDARRRLLATFDRTRDAWHHGGRIEIAGEEDIGSFVVLMPIQTSGAIVPLAGLRDWFTGVGNAPPTRVGAFSDWTTPRDDAPPLDLAGTTIVLSKTGNPAGPEAQDAEVLPGLVVRPALAPSTFWADPVVLITLLCLLATGFAAGSFLAFRVLQKEGAVMRARADFLTSVTHELKTPLSSIRLLSEMLDEGRVTTEERKSEYYKLLAGESSRLTVLIENVLDLGRLERGERAHDPQPHVPDEVVQEAVAVFAPVATRDDMQLDVDLAAGDQKADLDRGAFVQALLNVLENARKYAETGAVEVTSQVRNGSYELSVRDHGVGIPADQREAIFERFRRGEEQKNGSVPGVGLGLYLARAILRAHDGELRCQQPDGQGAEFVFTIPLTRSA